MLDSQATMIILLELKQELPLSGLSRNLQPRKLPDMVYDASGLICQADENDDVLLSEINSATIATYVNIPTTTCAVSSRIGSTSYANAVAAVFHSAMSRIVVRENGVPGYDKIRKKLIKDYGEHEVIIEDVLRKWCPIYRLRYERIEELDARQTIEAERSVLATFSLSEEEWIDFSKFYKTYPTGILERKDLGMHSSLANECNHAVVLTKSNTTYLTFMNSWGTSFADNGFFKVRDQSVLNLSFYDVYWTLEDLKESEIRAFQSMCAEVEREIT
ncbi:unnamed protein product [Rotaria socialis]|uniref:Peptidase C1A papain C-terminal domain-containing protein n=1 Tax=Rotaria socialis TaxID=392032 RepID=A0A817NS17_9BILA|nr:unnamed protein product [Rotaria socialis]CAF3264863.1 unnamed protein product [Rotaria socialis]CAF4157181.1 unnamed protein product [Rotaria socialis]CAF4298745.1 unnamed protein product [Rotaria socialis]